MLNRTGRKVVSVFVAVFLLLSFPSSGDAFLTELVVGGSILAEVGGTLVAALPQLTLFVSSVITLAKTSNEIADTVMSIVKFFVPSSSSSSSSSSPGQGASSSTGNGAAASTAPATGGASEPSADSQVPTNEADSSDEAQTVDASDSEVDALVKVIVEKFPLEMSLVKQITSLPENSSERDALGEGYGLIVAETTQAREQLITLILDAVKNGERKTVERFTSIAGGLEGQDRVALAPVLSKIVEQGAAFNKLYSLPDEGLLADLTDIYASYLQ